MPVYILNKPLGFSSHDVVAKSRKLLNTRRVGHAGTLDPLATGVLVLLTEEATKLSPFLTESHKHYLAWVSFGAATATLDAEGPVTHEADTGHLQRTSIEQALPAFLKLHEQLPPQYSAIKQGGIKGYEAARKGQSLDLQPRPAGYTAIKLLDFAKCRDELIQPLEGAELPATLGDYPTVLLELSVQAGTYIRAFARDLGEALGVPAHLSGLVRTASGQFRLEQAISLSDLPAARGIDIAEALPYPQVILSDTDTARVRQGQRLPLMFQSRVALLSSRGELVAVAEVQDDRMKLLRVWQ